MGDFLQKNAVSIIIAVCTLVTTYAVNTALYGYRLTAVEARQDRQGDAIKTLQENNTNIQVSLARIQTDIEYIKVQVNKL